MSDYHGQEYNYKISQYPKEPDIDLKRIVRAGEPAIDLRCRHSTAVT